MLEALDFPGFARQVIALKRHAIGDVYNPQAIRRRIQDYIVVQ